MRGWQQQRARRRRLSEAGAGVGARAGAPPPSAQPPAQSPAQTRTRRVLGTPNVQGGCNEVNGSKRAAFFVARDHALKQVLGQEAPPHDALPSAHARECVFSCGIEVCSRFVAFVVRAQLDDAQRNFARQKNGRRRRAEACVSKQDARRRVVVRAARLKLPEVCKVRRERAWPSKCTQRAPPLARAVWRYVHAPRAPMLIPRRQAARLCVCCKRARVPKFEARVCRPHVCVVIHARTCASLCGHSF